MVRGSGGKLNLLESVLEDAAYKVRLSAVIERVLAESPWKVHLVSLLTFGTNGEF